MPSLASPAFRLFLSGALVANVGTWMQATAQGWLVLRLTDSPASLGLASFAALVPTLILSLYAGVLADRLDRRRLLLGTQVAIGLLAAVLALLVTAGVVEFWQILVIAFLAGTAQALGLPAFQALVPMLVERRVVGNAIALNSAQFNLSRILGPVLAGILVASVGEAASFWLNAAAACVLVYALHTIRLPRQEAMARAEAGLWSNLLDGLRYVRSQKVLAALVVLAGAPALFVLPYIALMPLYARDILAIGAPGLGLLTAAVGLGAVGGALLLALLRPQGSNGRVLVVGFVWAAVALAAFALSQVVWLSCIALAALGAALIGYYTSTNTLVQLLSPSRFRGRILSVQALTSLGLLPVGSLVAGAVAARVGAPVTLLGGAVLALVALGLVLAWCPQLWSLRPDATLGAPGRARPPEAGRRSSTAELPLEG
ncbi:MAG: MFS transporter [Chloroflexota bacterium]|nr:MFS transporter [Chloroflexota bacterium]